VCRVGEACAGYDFVSDPASSGDGDGIDADPEDPGVVGPANLIPFHGTQMAGVLGATGNNQLGIAGIDWHARIMPVRVVGHGERSSHDLQQGLRYAAGLSNDAGTQPRKPAKIISISLGGGDYQPAEQTLFAQLRQAGVFVVAAAGNEASLLPVYPAAYAGVLAVTAVNRRKELASYANFGPAVDLAAPGGEPQTGQSHTDHDESILTTGGDPLVTPPGFTYTPGNGTSIAAPQVAGIIALMLAVDPDLTPDEFDSLLAAGRLTGDLGGDGEKVRNDRFGYGLIDAAKALRAAAALAAERRSGE
jgi:serine protease